MKYMYSWTEPWWTSKYGMATIPREEGGRYCAYIPMFGRSECLACGDSPEETVENLMDVLTSCVLRYRRNGWDLPDP